MYWLKACPRCRGDLREERDVYGGYVACMQCGYVPSVEEEQRLRASRLIERERAAGSTEKVA